MPLEDYAGDAATAAAIADSGDAAAGSAASSPRSEPHEFCWWVRSMPKPKPTGTTKGDAHASARRQNFMKMCQHLIDNPEEPFIYVFSLV